MIRVDTCKYMLIHVNTMLSSDSSIASPKTSDFLSRAFSWLLDTRKDTSSSEKKNIYIYPGIFSCAEVYRLMTSGCRGHTAVQRIRPGAGFETGGFC